MPALPCRAERHPAQPCPAKPALPCLASPCATSPCLRFLARKSRAGRCLALRRLRCHTSPCLSSTGHSLMRLACGALPRQTVTSLARPHIACVAIPRPADPSLSKPATRSHCSKMLHAPRSAQRFDCSPWRKSLAYSLASVKPPQPMPADILLSLRPSPMPTCWPTRCRRLATSVALN